MWTGRITAICSNLLVIYECCAADDVPVSVFEFEFVLPNDCKEFCGVQVQ